MLQDPNVERYIADVIKPLQKQINSLKSEIKQVNDLDISSIMCNLLKDNLTININTSREQDYGNTYTTVTVSILLDGKVICESSDTVR